MRALLATGAALALSACAAHASPPDTLGDGRGASCERGNASFCRTPAPLTAVPSPLPLAGAAVAYAAARRLRHRITPR